MLTILTPDPRTDLGRVNPFRVGSAKREAKGYTRSSTEAKLRQVIDYGFIQPCGFPLLVVELSDKASHLVVKWLAIVVLSFQTDIPSGREDVAVLAYVIQRCALAEAGVVGVVTRVCFATPAMIDVGYMANVFGRKLAMGPVDHAAELASVDEQHLTATVPERTAVTIAGEEPEAGGDLRRVEQLPRQRHHAVDQIGLDQVLADFSLA